MATCPSEATATTPQAGAGCGSGAGASDLATTMAPDSGKAGDPRMGSLLTGSADGDVTVVGFPFDVGCTRNGGRAGADGGPAAFRRFVPKLGCAVNPEFGCDLRGIRLGDAGDAHGETLEAAHADLTARVTQVLRAGAVPFVVGGGNDQSYANARALLDTKGDSQVSVVNIDAHLDVRPPLEGGVRHSGSPFWLLLNDADFDGVFTEFACQGMQCSAEHASFVTGHGGKLVWLSELLGTAGAPSATPSVCARFQDVLDSSPGKVFVSFDIDSIRSSDCPGVSCPATIGLTADHALRLCYLAGKHPRVAMVDVSEMNPAVEGYRTPRLVAFMLYHFLLGLSQRAKKGREPK